MRVGAKEMPGPIQQMHHVWLLGEAQPAVIHRAARAHSKSTAFAKSALCLLELMECCSSARIAFGLTCSAATLKPLADPR